MRKVIRILEVPLLLLAISFGTYVEDGYGMSIFLFMLSIIRLWVNVITDNITYRD